MRQNVYDQQDVFENFQNNRLSGRSENDLIEQPAIRGCLPPLTGKSVLDLGCGGGQLVKYCIEQGASEATGVDLSKNMLDYARANHSHERITYLQGSLEDIDLPDNQFDLIVSSLAMHYIGEYERVVQKVVSALRSNGYFIYSALHPHITARKLTEGWVRDEAGEKRFWPLDDYLDDGPRDLQVTPDKKAVIYHRSMSSAVNGLIQAGLTLDQIIEPTCSPEGLILQPHQVVEIRRPTFIIFKTQKLVC